MEYVILLRYTVPILLFFFLFLEYLVFLDQKYRAFCRCSCITTHPIALIIETLKYRLEYSLYRALNWPLFYTRVKKNKKQSKIGLHVSVMYWRWIALITFLTVLPGLSWWLVPFAYYGYFNNEYGRLVVLVVIFVPFFLYLLKWMKSWGRPRSEVWSIFDQDKVLLIIVAGLTSCLISSFLCSPIIYSTHSFWRFDAQDKDYIAALSGSVVAVSFLLSSFLYFFYHRSDFLYSTMSVDDARHEESLRSIVTLSAYNEYDYIPARAYRRKEATGLIVDQIGFYSAIDSDVSTPNNFVVSKYVLILFMPLLIPLISLFSVVIIGKALFLYSAPGKTIPLPIYYIIFNWSAASFAYFHWLAKVYLKPIFSSDIKTVNSRLKVIMHELKYLKAVFEGVKGNMYQLLFVSAIPAFLTIYSIVNQ